jgi:hypothetical protein
MSSGQQTLPLEPASPAARGSLPRVVGRRFWTGKEWVKSTRPSEDHHHLPRQPKLAWGKASCHGCGYATTEVPGKPILCGSCQQSTANVKGEGRHEPK